MNIPDEIAQRLSDEAVGAALMLELDTSEGFLRLYRGENGVFRDVNGTDWIGCTLLRMGDVKVSSNATAPTWEAQLSYVHDPDREDILSVIREYGVAAIPVSAFFAENPVTHVVRLCFAKADATLDAAVERLAAARTAFA